MRTTLDAHELIDQASRLRKANFGHARQFPGDGSARQPVHTVYGGAHLFRADTARKLGTLALKAMEEHAPDAAALAEAVGIGDAALAGKVHARVAEKLRAEAVEDFRVDFEDGYGYRAGEEEDGHAVAAAREMAAGLAAGTLPPFVGIRVKPLTEEHAERAVRTLDLFLTTLLDAGGGALPRGFVVTLPKVTSGEQVDFLGDVLQSLEPRLGLPVGSLPVELMVETPQAVVGPDGRWGLPGLVRAGEGRVTGAHFGAYDYTAALGIAAAHQSLRHPACDFARAAMQASLAGTGVRLSDGATTLLPVAPHRAGEGAALSDAQAAENRAAVHRAWRLHYEDVRHALAGGFYQGWDLHPAQLVSRYAAVFAFFLEGVDETAARLRNFVERAAQATRVGSVFDDAATGQGLLNHFLRALACGALSEDEAAALTGLSPDALRARSFSAIVAGRS
ncbi:MAG TPA: hypothetical protein VHG91_08570 [Longimicrobium sp.]|nr:hypothetical protein [Longimicrobium sp.]